MNVNILDTIIEFSKGKKTFAIGVLMILLGMLQNDNQMVLEGLGFITLRIGIANR